VVLGIEATKIAVAVHGVKKLLDPLGKGNYIWPALSPGGTQLVAVDLERGAFVCDLEGNVNVRLGRRNAPAWTRDGRWIVYMDDRDDGHSLISSDLYAVSADGATTVRLTDTPDVHEMYPDCSPAESIILCSSLAGDLYLLTYGEE
jgi:Tol biopolymer transport system component